MTRTAGWLLLLVGLLATAWDALRPGDVALADHEWEVATSQQPGAYGDRLYDFCALTQRDVAPWQDGHARAQARLGAIGRGRRALLRDEDRLLRLAPPPTP